MPNSKNLYEHLILEHNKNPHNYGKLSDPDLTISAYNPLCGDSFQIYLALEDLNITAMKFEGNGCAISKASASMLTEIVKGKTQKEFQHILQAFNDMFKNDSDSPIETQVLGNLIAFSGVRAFPMRIKCAILPWRALSSAFDNYTLTTGKQ